MSPNEEGPDIDLDVPGRYEDNPEFDPDSMDNTVVADRYTMLF